MKKGIKKIITLIISFVIITTQVKGLSGSGAEYQDEYEQGITQVRITKEDWVTLYGKSICNGTTCPTVEYAGQTRDFEDALSKAVECTNGEKYIMYQIGGSGMREHFDATNSEQGYSGTMYWAEDYYVKCVESDTGEETIIETVTPNEGTNNGTTNGDNNNNEGTKDEYNSSTTVENPEQGVTTYFTVLGIVGIISYIMMIVLKKYNLFKNV